MWAKPKNRPVLGALRQQHRRSPHEARGRSAKRINTKTRAEGRRNQAQGTLFFACFLHAFSPPLKGRAVTSAQTWTSNRNLTLTPPAHPTICMPLTYPRPSTTSLCLRGCVTADLGKGQVGLASSTAPLFYEQTPTCRRIQRQSPDTYRTKDVRPHRTWQTPDVIYYFRNVHIKHLCASLHTY
jgi:hypothetical protein